MGSKFRVIGYKEGRLTDPKDIIYDKETERLRGVLSCTSWAFIKGATHVLIIKGQVS